MNTVAARRDGAFLIQERSVILRVVARVVCRIVPRIRQFRLMILLACAAQLGLSRPAFAHAHLVRSSPTAGAHLNTSPRIIQLWFSEQPEVVLTTITLTGAAGDVVPTGGVIVVEGEPLSVMVPINGVLANGAYTIAWRTAATDGHPSHGTFTFRVEMNDGAIGSVNVLRESVMTNTPTAATVAANSNADSAAMGVESPSYVAIRWLEFAALVIVIGTVAFRVLVLPRVSFNNPLNGTAESLASDVSAMMVRRLAGLGLTATGLVLVTAFGRLFAERTVMVVGMKSGMSIGLSEIVSHTAWGHAWLLQFGIAILACIGFALARTTKRSARTGWTIAAFTALILGVTPSLSGHAIAAPHLRWLGVIADSVHVIAAGGWLGGLFALSVIGIPTVLAVSRRERFGVAPTIAALVSAFSPTALTFATLVVCTGLVSAWLRLGSISGLWRTRYGVVLLVKLGFVMLVFVGGAFNWLRMRGALTRGAVSASGENDSSHVSVSHFRRSGMLELIAGAIVIVVTAILVATPTPMW